MHWRNWEWPRAPNCRGGIDHDRCRHHRAGPPSSCFTSCSAASSNRWTSVEFANLDAARHRRHLSELRRGLQGLEGGGAAHGGQRADALFHRPPASPARPRRQRRAPDALRTAFGRRRLATARGGARCVRADRLRRSIAATRRETLGKRSKSPRTGSAPSPSTSGRRATLRRFVADWVAPRWRQIALAFVFTAGLAATTGGYPLIIKHSFDSLMQAGQPRAAVGADRHRRWSRPRAASSSICTR